MISKMKKLLFLGPEASKESVLQQLQKLDVIELKPIEKAQGKILEQSRAELEATIEAFQYLSQFTPTISTTSKITNQTDHPVIPDDRGESNTVSNETSDETRMVERVLALKNDIQKIELEKAFLTDAILKIKPWGRFDLKQLKEIEKLTRSKIQFWSHNSSKEGNIPSGMKTVDLYTSNDLNYFLSFSDVNDQSSFTSATIEIEGCIEAKFEHDLTTLEGLLGEQLTAQDSCIKELNELAFSLATIETACLRKTDEFNFVKTSQASGAELDGDLFILQGWCPSDRVEQLNHALEDHAVEIAEIKPDKNENAPTQMKNGAMGDIGSDLVKIYDTPNYKDWDPSSWVFFSFAIFFAMVLNDGGYGITLAILFILLKVFLKNPTPAVTRFINLSLVLSCTSIIYGVMTGGFYGAWPSIDNPTLGWLNNFKLFNSAPTTGGDQIQNQKTIDFMMRLSVIIGLVHISLSLVLKSMRQVLDDKDFITPFSNISWMVAIWAFYFWYGNPDKVMSDPSMIVFGVCMVVVFLTSAGTFKPGALIAGGAAGLYNGVQFFSDILSYLRLFALGMSGALLAQTFNTLSYQLWNWDVPVIGMVLAALVFFGGHLITLGLGIMGGVIHGLRLNFLEWYRWSFDGDGKEFQPFRLLVQSQPRIREEKS